MTKTSLISSGVIVLAALVFIALERKFPYTKGQKLFREQFLSDIFLYTFFQSFVLGWVIGKFIELIDRHRVHWVSDWPLWAQVLLFFVTHDFYIYWFHRAQHHSKWLWRIHEAHHSAEDVDWLAGSRSHALEILVNQTIEYAPIMFLGGAPEVVVIKGVIDAVWGMYIHSNIDVKSGKLQYVINGPEMHRWHHAIEITEGGINFGTKLAIWDYLFGTAVRPPVKPRGFGLSDVIFPKNYFAQTLFAFRRFPKDAPPPLPNKIPTSIDAAAAE